MQQRLDALRRSQPLRRLAARLDSARPILGLALLVCGVFGLACWAPFIYDDAAFIFQNADMVGPWPGWRHFFLHPYSSDENYEPVSVALHRVLVALCGHAPFWYRATSILFHLGNVILFWLLLRRLLKDGRGAWLFAALFAVYPAHTEVIAISTFKKHLIVACAVLSTLHLIQPWSEEKPAWWRRALAFPVLLLALFTKEHGLLVPPIALSTSLLLARDWRARLRRDAGFYAGLFSICLGFVYWRAVVVPRPPAAIVEDSLVLHWLTSLKCLLWYARELLLPWQLCQEHSLIPVQKALSWETLGLFAGLGALAALGRWVFRRDRVAFAGLMMAFIWLGPFLNIVPFLNVSLVANRYLYLAIAGVLLCAARLSAPLWDLELWNGYRAPAAACLAVGLLYIGLAMRNLARYSDPVDVWTCAVGCAPVNPRAHMSLAQAYAVRLRYADAEREFRTAIRLGQGYSTFATTDLAMLYAQQGDFQRAAWLTGQMARYWPDWRTVKLLGAAELKLGHLKKARHALEFAIRLNPYDAVSRVNLGVYYERVKDDRRAELTWRAAAGLPGEPDRAYKYLAELYVKEKRLPEARKAYEQSLEAEPLQVDAVSGLAGVYARLGEPAKGRELFDKLVTELSKQAQGAVSVADQASTREERLSEGVLAAAHKARASFLQRYPSS